MSDFISDYGEQLRQAGWRRLQRRRRIARIRPARHSRKLVVSLVALAIAAPAVAQTGVWRPLLGDGVSPAPTASDLRAAERQRALLTVLRRDQTDADRGPQTRYALRFLGTSVSDVHTASIRLVHLEPDGRGIVLIPVGRRNLPGTMDRALLKPAVRRRFEGPDRLCLFAADADHGRLAGGGFDCYSTADLLAGRAAAGLGPRAYGLVPDGVARLQILPPNGQARTVEVHDNFYIYTGSLGYDTVRWIAPDGHVVKTLERDRTLLAPPKPDPKSSLCDPAVPRDRCASRRYSSPPGSRGR